VSVEHCWRDLDNLRLASLKVMEMSPNYITLVVDGWFVTFGTARAGCDRSQPQQIRKGLFRFRDCDWRWREARLTPFPCLREEWEESSSKRKFFWNNYSKLHSIYV